MPLHKHYDTVRRMVDRRFLHYRRRSVQEGLDIERIELWHDLLEAALEADKKAKVSPDSAVWKSIILEELESRYQRLHPGRK
ncbi:MAG: hypothetical protein ACLFTB_08580 [Desulfovibrionales bacterium]